MADAAFELAALRACRTRQLSGSARSAAEVVAAETGRRLVDVGEGSAGIMGIGWADGYEPNPQEGLLSVRRLTSSPLITLAACLGLCWQHRTGPPYPGRRVTLDEVLGAVAALGADRIHTLGALRHDLSLSGLIELDGQHVRLGPAIAVLSPAQIDALRRFSDLLPGSSDG